MKLIEICDVNSEGHKVRLSDGSYRLIAHSTADLFVGQELEPLFPIGNDIESFPEPALPLNTEPMRPQDNILHMSDEQVIALHPAMSKTEGDPFGIKHHAAALDQMRTEHEKENEDALDPEADPLSPE